jgi:hypothetical protein
MPTTLQTRFGHEENFSRYLLESGQFAQLLQRAGFAVAGEGVLELPVAKGHEGREGRLDIYQPTTAGVVIGEMQYGTSDSNHRNRFDGYAKSVANPAAIVWVAEEFRAKDIEAVASGKVPVLCVKAKEAATGEIRLTVIGGARLSAQSLACREAKACADAWGWVKAIDWTKAACEEAWSNGRHAVGLIYTLAQTDKEWVERLLARTGLLGKTAPSVHRRLEVVKSCADAEQIEQVVLAAVRAAREQCKNDVDMNEIDRHLEWRRQELLRLEESAVKFEFGRESYKLEAQRVRHEIKVFEQELVLAGVA